MRFRDDFDANAVNWQTLAARASRYAQALPPGVKRNTEMDYALACGAMAQSRELLRRSSAGPHE